MSELTDKQLRFIDTYFKTNTITETCKILKISRTTAYNYLNDESIKLEMDRRRTELINDTTIYLQANLKICSNTLIDIIKDQKTPPQVKINAINSIFNNCNKLTETNDIMTKLAEIEQRLAEQEV